MINDKRKEKMIKSLILLQQKRTKREKQQLKSIIFLSIDKAMTLPKLHKKLSKFGEISYRTVQRYCMELCNEGSITMTRRNIHGNSRLLERKI